MLGFDLEALEYRVLDDDFDGTADGLFQFRNDLLIEPASAAPGSFWAQPDGVPRRVSWDFLMPLA